MKSKPFEVQSLKFIVALVPVILLLVACKEETEAPTTDFQYDYFPLAVGKYWVYQVDSVLFVPMSSTRTRRDSATNFIKEEITASFVDNVGDTIYKVERFERKRDTEPWQIKKVFTIHRTRTQAIQAEDNLRFIKLAFPLQEGKQWNSTIFPTEGLTIPIAGQSVAIFKDWKTKVMEVDKPMQIGSFNFDKTATLSYANETAGIIEYRSVKEVFAKNIGLVKRDWRIMDTQCETCCNGTGDTLCTKLPWEEKAEKGFILKQILIAHN